jgi:cytoskeletal protein CcmA (bactofilin family)
MTMNGCDPGEINALLGHGTEFTGKLTFEGTVRIDGRFEGEVFARDTLIIGEGAEVKAEVDVGTLIVKGGVVVGNIRARNAVEIHAPGRVVGNILSPSLYIGKGVVFDGHCRMQEEEPAVPSVGLVPPEGLPAAEYEPEPGAGRTSDPRLGHAGAYPSGAPLPSSVPNAPVGWPQAVHVPKRR